MSDFTCPAPRCDEEHLDQTFRGVHKHSHTDNSPCTRPWSALCQTAHGDICHASDHETWADAFAALAAHLEARAHIEPGSGDTEVLTPHQAVRRG